MHTAIKRRHLHDQREQTVIPANNQEKREIPSTDALLHTCREDNVSYKRHSCRAHNVPTTVLSPIRVHSLEKHHEPSDDIRCDCHALRINGRETQSLDQSGQEVRDGGHSDID